MTEFVTYATNHSRPWMELVERYHMPEDEAKRLFDRVEPCLAMEQRYQKFMELIRHAEAEGYRRRG